MIRSYLHAQYSGRLHLGYWPSYNHPDPKQLSDITGPARLSIGTTTPEMLCSLPEFLLAM